MIDLASCRHPAVFFVNGLGDQLIALPALRALGTLFPGRLRLLLGEGNYSFVFHDAHLGCREPTRVWWSDHVEAKLDVGRIMRTAPGCDLFISLATWCSPSVVELASRLGAKKTVGYFEQFDYPVFLERYGNMFDYLFAIPRMLEPSLRVEDFAGAPRFSTAAEDAAARFIKGHISEGERLLFVHPESTDPQRSWMPEHWSWVLSRFLGAHPGYKLLVCSVNPYPLDLGRHQSRAVTHDRHLELALASMRAADLFIGIDSCFLHAADLFRVPGVGLFGPTRPDEWGFRWSRRTRHAWGEGSMQAVRKEAVLESLLEVAACAS